jgi:AAA domain, putative AbiEii toxin, Type IV TA system
MRSKWTLVVEGLGRIERAEVELRPLTLFVGENNSGKSYLSSLLWDFLARMPDVFSFNRSELNALAKSAKYQACSQWLADKIAHQEEHTLTEGDIRLLLSWFNERLEEKKNAVAQRIFGRPSMTVGRFEVRDLSLDAPFSLVFRQSSQGLVGDVGLTATGYAPRLPRKLDVEIGPESDSSSPSHRTVLIALIGQLLAPYRPIGYQGTEYDPGDALYLPASRTGFMLLYKGVLGNLIERGLANTTEVKRSQSPNLQLTAPMSHFLQALALGLKPSSPGRFAAEADLIERHAFPGTVALAGSVGVNEVEYRYDPAAPPLPMQLSSSLITELAPLILVLRHAADLPFLVLEEPEAHLHPHLQRLVAQVIARLVRKGVYVCVTTHSADFCQQINNFIKLGSLAPERRAVFQAQYNYEAQDYLEAGEVGGYQFRVDQGGRAAVSRLEESPSGLAMPTFNQELIDLSKQTLDLQRAVEVDE